MSRAERAARHAVGLGVTLAVLSALAPGAEDSFPISTYPMFARPRGDLMLHAVAGVGAGGTERPLGPALVGSDEVLQAKALISASVAGGPRALAELCTASAKRVAERAELADVVRVEIVQKLYDPVAYFTVSPFPRERTTLWGCAVPRRGGR